MKIGPCTSGLVSYPYSYHGCRNTLLREYTQAVQHHCNDAGDGQQGIVCRNVLSKHMYVASSRLLILMSMKIIIIIFISNNYQCL